MSSDANMGCVAALLWILYSWLRSSLPSFAGYEETLTRLAAILAKHFADPRIVGTGEMSSNGPWEWGWDGLSQRTMGMGVGWHGWKAVFYLNGGHVGIRLGVLSPHQRLAEA